MITYYVPIPSMRTNTLWYVTQCDGYDYKHRAYFIKISKSELLEFKKMYDL